MPIYEYQCQSCGHQLEIFQKADDVPMTKCAHCGEESMKKLISAPSFHLKGEGWYVTDFRDKDKCKKTAPTTGEETSKKSEPKKEVETTKKTPAKEKGKDPK